jgi:hypothetical protein
MMNFDRHDYQKASQTLEKTKYLLSTYIESHIIMPLNNAAAGFSAGNEAQYSHEGFHRAIAGYIRFVSQTTQIYGCTLSFERAHSEAVFLINHFYRGIHADGMEGALLDAVNPTRNPIVQLVYNLNTAIRDYACTKHLQAVKLHYIDSASWQIRYIMVLLVLQEGVEPGFPINTWPPERLCGCLFELIRLSLKTG